MLSLKALFLTLLALYAITFFVIITLPQNRSDSGKYFHQSPFLASDQDVPSQQAYKFIDPSLAYNILSQLDGYKAAERSQKYKTSRKESYLGFKKDDKYCDKNREYFVNHPESVFTQMNIIHGSAKGSFIQNIISQIGNDLHIQKSSRMNRKERAKPIHDLMPSANGFFTSSSLYSYFKMNKQFSCLSQESSQIPGSAKFSRKDIVAGAATKYINSYQDRPHCITHDKYFPETWLLSNVSQCKAFFKKLASPEHKKLQEERRIVYIKKIPNSHRGEGVQPLNKYQEKKLVADYKNGAACGKNNKNIVMQQYVHNSLLLKGHKFDFRMYMLIASVNPIMAYYYDGFLRVSLIRYDVNSNDKKVLLTNLVLSQQIHEDAKSGKKFQGMDEEELKNAQQWSFDQLQSYLLEEGIINDSNWLNNYLRPEFKKAMIHLVRLASDSFVKHSSFYGLYGVDFMLDTDLKLWFIESNAGPAFGGYSKSMDKFVTKMIKDHFEIVYGLLRSRMKRVIEFVNDIITDKSSYEIKDGKVILKNIEETGRSFDEITKNYFEKEFEPSPENEFEKIIDENEGGVHVYQGLIDESCL